MSDPNFLNAKLKLHEHLRFLIAQPIREFQEQHKVQIESVTVVTVNGNVERVKIKLCKDDTTL